MTRKMKDSGVEWIDEIPESWSIVRLKQVFSFRKGLSITKDNLVEKGIKVISYGQIHSKSNTGVCLNDSLIRYVGEEYLETGEKCLVKKNDFIFADTSEDLDGAGNCVYIDSNEDIFAGYHTIILTPINSKSMNEWKYFAYLYKTDCWRSQLRSRVSGIKLFSITQKILKQTEVILPDTKEQKKIVNYLDKKCTQIDEIIEKEKQVIERLKEYKQSVITETVTKGLNLNVKMKDSGVEWIGEIPEHWENRKLKTLLLEAMKYGANESGEIYDENEPRYIRITDITLDSKLKDEGKLSLPLDIAKPYLLEDGDILFARSGATVGKSFIFKEEYGLSAFAGYLIKAKLNKNIAIPQFVFYYTLSNSYNEWKKRIFIQATIQNIGADKYSNMNVAIPTINEQQQIVDYLDKKCSSIDKLISNKEKLIEKLTEYKKSLIYECVTGKREVQ